MPNNSYLAKLLAHAVASAATYNGDDQTNESARGIHVVVDVTAVASSGTLTVTIEGKDPASGKYYPLLASAALDATGTVVLKVYPGLTAATNLAANDILPRNWRVKSVVATGTISATISAHLIG